MPVEGLRSLCEPTVYFWSLCCVHDTNTQLEAEQIDFKRGVMLPRLVPVCEINSVAKVCSVLKNAHCKADQEEESISSCSCGSYSLSTG